jgi:hypothetical protein
LQYVPAKPDASKIEQVAMQEFDQKPESDQNSQIRSKPGKLNRILTMLVLILLVFLCVSLGGPYAVSTFSMVVDRDEIVEILDAYMDAMERGDATTAHSLFSTKAQTIFSIDDFQQMLNSSDAALFDGYEAVQLEQFSVIIGEYKISDPLAPEGTVSYAFGKVVYIDGSLTDFEAMLQKEGGIWKLYGITITK